MTHALMRGVDRSAFAVSLVRRLRARGVPIGFSALESFVRGIEAAPPTHRTRLYWTARVSLIRRQADLAVFDAVFEAVFADAMLVDDSLASRLSPQAPTIDPRSRPTPGSVSDDDGGTGLPWATRPKVVAGSRGGDPAFAVPERLPGDVKGLADVPFEQLDAREMALLGHWLEIAARSWPSRRSRRLAVDARGRRPALRPTIARARRTGWEPIELVRTAAREQPRRVVMLCDVSQSMQAQAAAYFHLMRALATRADAEVFAFATSLTRLTSVLAHHSAPAAVELAEAKVLDRFGGTRIAANLQTLLSSHHGSAVRGSVVIIGSDGWDSEPPDRLAAAMARLRRRAHRVIWMNPRASAPGFEPRVASMAAALPYCDALLPADTFASLARVIEAIGRPAIGRRALERPVSSRASRGSRAGTVPG